MNKYISYVGVIALAAGLVTAADARGPKPSADVRTYCGDPQAATDDGSVIFNQNVAVVIQNASGDNGPNTITANYEIDCLETVQRGGKGRPARPATFLMQTITGTTNVDVGTPAVIEVNCPLGDLDPDATEWKAVATITVDGGRTSSDQCEEVPVM